ncbi:hypothetical protein [Sedimentitalea todarodis]|uniref:Uncharacterized protein n=1 Tax=Sedimentitalea todarodis TaxID=1631240 RepID=A0ABU3VE87_9RHOB|nr:hypothetical protein [Sedimentitalea todarodis]MDU9004490.1 hypothetical protein [Sedimentitalea todarodis]
MASLTAAQNTFIETFIVGKGAARVSDAVTVNDLKKEIENWKDGKSRISTHVATMRKMVLAENAETLGKDVARKLTRLHLAIARDVDNAFGDCIKQLKQGPGRPMSTSQIDAVRTKLGANKSINFLKTNPFGVALDILAEVTPVLDRLQSVMDGQNKMAV